MVLHGRGNDRPLASPASSTHTQTAHHADHAASPDICESTIAHDGYITQAGTQI
jgi:hypothetical protein